MSFRKMMVKYYMDLGYSRTEANRHAEADEKWFADLLLKRPIKA